MIKDSTAYRLIQEFYGDQRAQRSQVLLMDHIDQGIEILRRHGANEDAMEAYAVHPIFQNDSDLLGNYLQASLLDPIVVLYAIEYRNIANNFLSDAIEKGQDGWGREAFHVKRQLKLSPIKGVNDMLVADKVQNRKDFLAYHLGSHARSDELDHYFKMWLKKLEISEERYQELVEGL